MVMSSTPSSFAMTIAGLTAHLPNHSAVNKVRTLLPAAQDCIMN
jgi:hypothetical protein